MPPKTLIVTDSHSGKRLDLFIQHPIFVRREHFVSLLPAACP